MQQTLTRFTVETKGRRLYEFTDDVARWIADGPVQNGLLTLFCRHTSASLLINENAASAVQRDLLRWLDQAAPDSARYEHDDEGPDDMPAHIRSMLTGVNLTIPVMDGRMMLGTWQGIYLAEHRTMPHRRQIIAHLLGEA